MPNRWGIPPDVEKFVLNRDKECVYCGIKFTNDCNSRKFKASWEHIVNDVRICGTDNIALCCMSCNASKGSKLLEDWLSSEYCVRKGITRDSVAPVVKSALRIPPKLPS